MTTRALGLLLGYAADRLLGDPRRRHPVAGFGAVAAWLERRSYADSRRRGAAYTLLLVGGCVTAGVVAERATHPRRLLHLVLVAASTWTVLGGRSLEREAARVRTFLDADDLPGARQRLTHLVGRDTTRLDESEVARAVVESVAENTSDAVVAPLLWGAVLGVPGLLGYRAANTLDAMVGHHTSRYEHFGWAAARLDDVLNLLASRATGLLGVLVAPTHAAASWQAWRRDAQHHPSPNAGVPEAVFAGALGVRLGGTNRYGDHVERRAWLGAGRPAVAQDIDRALGLAGRVDVAALALAVGLAHLARPRQTAPR